jgi:VWFA-related protein
MNFFKLSPLAATTLLTAAAFTAIAQPNPSKLVALNVVALDSTGKPVPDLTASDISIFDNNERQKIVNLRLNHTDGPRALVILFDLMNSNQVARGAVSEALKTSVAHLPPADHLYLYLMVEDGSLYPVHGLDSPDSDASWTQHAGALLDAAMNKVNQLKPEEIRTLSPARFNTTVQSLGEMGGKMAAFTGRKELLWITYGIPSSIHYQERGWFDGTPILRQLGARFVQANIAIYTADPGVNLQQGMLNRDSLDVLTGATGGRTFSTIDLTQAINQAEADARTNYTLEYEPSPKNWDGKYHKLRVSSARKGIRIQSEHGYFAVSGS